MTAQSSELLGVLSTLLAGRDIGLHVKHLHAGNSSRNKRGGKKYVTVASIVEYPDKTVIGKGVARCSKGDTPSRKVGRNLAIARAIQDVQQTSTT